MKGIRRSYIYSILAWLVISALFFALNKSYKWLNGDDLNLLLGVIAVAVSILSLGLATMQRSPFEGKIYLWNVSSEIRQANNDHITPIGTYNCITLKIDNRGKDPIDSLNLSLRVPTKIFYRDLQSINKHYHLYEFKETTYINHSIIKFLGNVSGDSDFITEHFFNLDAWDKNRVIFITVSGDNIRPTTYKITSDQKTNLLNSNSKEPYIPQRA